MTNPITPQEAHRLIYNAHEVVTDKVKDGTDGANWQVQWKDSYWNHLPDAPYEDAVMYAYAPRLAATIAADTIEYGIRIEFPDQQFMHFFDARTKWTTDKTRAEHDLVGLREDEQLYEAKIRLVARRVSLTWEVKE